MHKRTTGALFIAIVSIVALAAIASPGCRTQDHPVGVTQNGVSQCVNCHQSDFDRTTDPVHVDRFPTTCEVCHGTETWTPADYNHPWPLNGAHFTASCESCHTGDPPVYEGTPMVCVECHQPEWQATTDPAHAGVFPTNTCDRCHSEEVWQPSTYNHSWPLAGTHADTSCLNCHTGDPPVIEGLARECVGCHRANYDATTDPVHAGLYPTTCENCHNVLAWQPAAVDHSWPLTGAHAGTACLSCHLGDPPLYAGTSRECAGCHQTDFDGTTDPPHMGVFPTTCESCHSTTSWRGAMFDHTWPLTGAHATTACASCHTGDPPVYVGTPQQCVDCHRSDYDGSPFPGHDTYPVTCQDCHSTNGWTPAMGGVHPNGAFPLNDKHDGITCLQCHDNDLGSPVDGMNTDCVGCHEGEHTRASMDNKHRDVGRYPSGAAPPNFCLDCHADGRN